MLTMAPAVVASIPSAVATAVSPDALLDLAGKLAPMASIALNVSPFGTIGGVVKKKDVGDLPILPYSSMFCNGFLWMLYGLMKNEPKIYVPNGVGALLGIYYFLQFSRFAPSFKTPTSTLPGSVKQHLLGSLAIAAAGLALMQTNKAVLLGYAAVGFCMLLFGSPLAALKTVFESKSAESIPIPMALATWTNCFLWIFVGTFTLKDPLCVAPNFVGISLATVQLLLKAKYGNGLTALEGKNKQRKLPTP